MGRQGKDVNRLEAIVWLVALTGLCITAIVYWMAHKPSRSVLACQYHVPFYLKGTRADCDAVNAVRQQRSAP